MRLCSTHIDEYLDSGKLIITLRSPQSAVTYEAEILLDDIVGWLYQFH